MPSAAPPFANFLTLICHTATPAPVVRSVEACASIREDGTLSLTYRLWGDMARLLIPEEKTPGHTDNLWEHTCFEVFIGVAGNPGYVEFNFSPSGQWAAYAFSDYRQPDLKAPRMKAPAITTRRFAGRLEIEARISPEALPANANMLQLNLTAVVESTDRVDGCHSYWALRHPAERPDFHHRDAFTLALANPRNTA
jgi:hypothetical protein